ncbi:MAG: 50S ribosomal protein L25/general stress protein Ctc [Herbaspirillum sp.]
MKIVAFPRKELGSGASRRQRIAGQTPAIVYGGTTTPPVSLSLDHNAIYHALKKEAIHSSILDLEVDGKTEQVLLRDFQMHAYKQLVMHVDFQRIDASQKINVKVPLHFLNAELSSVVKQATGIINHVVVDLEISCLPKDLPEFIDVDLGGITVGDVIRLSSLKLPEGVTAVLRPGEEDPAIVIASVPTVNAAAAADEAADAATAAAAAPAPAAAATAPAAPKKDK